MNNPYNNPNVHHRIQRTMQVMVIQTLHTATLATTMTLTSRILTMVLTTMDIIIEATNTINRAQLKIVVLVWELFVVLAAFLIVVYVELNIHMK